VRWRSRPWLTCVRRRAAQCPCGRSHSAALESTEQQTAEQRHGHRECQHRPIDSNIVQPRQTRRRNRNQQPQRTERQAQAEYASERADDYTLKQKISGMCQRPAPSAARTASSRAGLPRVRKQVATFAQAISSTTPSSPSAPTADFPTSPLHPAECRIFGPSRALWNRSTLNPGGAGKLVHTVGISRAISVFAAASVTPAASAQPLHN